MKVILSGFWEVRAVIKLLKAHFARLKFNKFFWVCVLGAFAVGLTVVFTFYHSLVKYGSSASADAAMMLYTGAIGFVGAVIVSLFLGTDYSDGTLRNKIITGSRRTDIYISSLIVSIAATAAICAAYLLPVFALGIPLLGGFVLDGKSIALYLVGSLALLLAFCSIFTAVSMSVHNKTIASVASIVGVMFVFFLCTYLLNRLGEPEFIDKVVSYDPVTEEIVTETVRNASYIGGGARTFVLFLLDFLPSGQSILYMSGTATHLWQMPLYSLLIAVAATAGGILYFRKKDIR